jgi:flagellar biosynthesis chaperone FliJ
VVNSVNAWERAIQRYIDNLDEMKAKAQENIAAAEELAVQRNVPKIIEIYQKVISYMRGDVK